MVDRRILAQLQKDGRLSNADLARKVHVSPATCHRRTQRLFAEGYLKGVRALVAPEKVERGALGPSWAWSWTAPPLKASASSRRPSSSCRFILDCHIVAGDFDYILKIRVRDMADFNRLHGTKLIALPGVRQTRTFFVMKEVIDNAPLDF